MPTYVLPVRAPTFPGSCPARSASVVRRQEGADLQPSHQPPRELTGRVGAKRSGLTNVPRETNSGLRITKESVNVRLKLDRLGCAAGRAGSKPSMKPGPLGMDRPGASASTFSEAWRLSARQGQGDWLRLHRRTALTLLGGGLAAGCLPSRPDRSADRLALRYRLTMELLVDGRPVRGATVRQFKRTEDPKWFPSDGAGQTSWQGEATPIPIGDGAWLFAMLEGYVTVNGERQRSYGPWTPYHAVLGRIDKRVTSTQADYDALSPDQKERFVSPAQARALLGSAPVALELNELPILVAFRTPAVPGSGVVILPEQAPEAFPGVAWGHCTVQATDDPVGFGQVEAALPWITQPVRAVRTTWTGESFNLNSSAFRRDW